MSNENPYVKVVQQQLAEEKDTERRREEAHKANLSQHGLLLKRASDILTEIILPEVALANSAIKETGAQIKVEERRITADYLTAVTLLFVRAHGISQEVVDINPTSRPPVVARNLPIGGVPARGTMPETFDLSKLLGISSGLEIDQDAAQRIISLFLTKLDRTKGSLASQAVRHDAEAQQKARRL